MKKKIADGCLALLIWGFWFLGMRGHIACWHETDFFQCGSAYWKQFALLPGGWTAYAANFLLQFYRWTAVGALIQTLLVVLLCRLCWDFVRKLGIAGGRIWGACLPALAVFLLQAGGCLSLEGTLRILVVFSFLYCYWLVDRAYWRYGLFTFAFPLAFLLLGVESVAVLYFNLAVLEIWKGKGRMRWGAMGVWLVLLVSFPAMWRWRICFVPAEELFAWKSAKEWLYLLIVGFLPFLWGMDRFLKGKSFGRLEGWLLAAGGVIGACLLSDFSFERDFRWERAVSEGRWEEVLRLADGMDRPDREKAFLIHLALANCGELGERLLDYSSEWGIGGLYLPRDSRYASTLLGSELYALLKLPNEAIHYVFQASVVSPQGMDFRTLKRLAELNLLKRDSLLAEKYIAILENAIGYGGWCAEKRRQWADSRTERILPTDRGDFFIGGRPFLSDMARIWDAGRSREMATDYILCGLLLKKDLPKFVQLFKMLHPAERKRIPRIYQEALLVAMNMESKELGGRNFPIDEGVRSRFKEYTDLYRLYGKNRRLAGEALKKFKNTWWYYLNFVEPHPINEQGFLVEESH